MYDMLEAEVFFWGVILYLWQKKGHCGWIAHGQEMMKKKQEVHNKKHYQVRKFPKLLLPCQMCFEVTGCVWRLM